MSVVPYTHDEGDHFIIRTPNKEWSGKVYGLTFIDGVALLDASESELARELDEQFGYEVVLPTGFTPWENAPDPGSLVVTRREYRVDMPKRGLTVQGKRDKKTGEAVGSDA